jgi:hypothetical protein
LLVLLWPRFFYGNDDLLEFSVARDEGLSWTTLSLNVFQHFGPYNRAGHLLVFKLTDLSPVAGLALMAVNDIVMLATALWFMTELRLSATRRALALVLIGLSVSVSESAVWFVSSMLVLPAIAATFAICAAHVRGVRTGLRRWHVIAVVLLVLGQLTQERPLFALPLCVLADVLLLWRMLPWAERLGRLWRLRWPLLAMTVVAGAIAAALKAFVVVDQMSAPDIATTLRAMLSALTNYLLPGLLNRPLEAPAPLPIQLAVLGGLLVVGVVLSRLRPGNAGPVLFAAASFCMYYGFLKFSPLLNEDTITANAERLSNAVYVAVPAVIALAHLGLPRRWAATVGRRSWRLTATVAVALAAYLTVTNVLYLDRQWSDTTRAREYLDAVRADRAEWSDPDVTLVPLFANPAMATGWSVPYSRHDGLLSLISKGFTPGDLGPRPVLIDDQGAVRPAALEVVSSRVDVAGGSCGPAERPSHDADLVVAPRVVGGPLFVELTYQAEQDTVVQLAAGLRDGWTLNQLPTRLDAGQHTQLLPVDPSSLEVVDLRALYPADADFCVQRASIVRPVIVEPDGGCLAVDRYGRPGREVPCP